ncbi:MAG TPA: peptidoglycan-binding domain-containing protein [Thermosynechococcaceae cyanobacterium]
METPASSHGTQAVKPRSLTQRFLTRVALQAMAIVLPITILASVAHAGSAYLQRGDRGPEVAELQRALNDRGISVSVDSVFGSETEAAVIRFQREQRVLNVDGVVGEDTLQALGLGSPFVGVACNTFDAPSPSQEAFGKRYRVIIPSKNPRILASVRSYCRNAYAVATPLGSYVAVGSFPDRGTAEGRKDYLRRQGFRDAHVRYF